MKKTMECSVLGMGVAFAELSEKSTEAKVFSTNDMESALLSPRVRRRMSVATKLSIAAGERACSDAGVEADSLPCIFASIAGEIKVTDVLCRAIAKHELPVSPTQFHNSVHNTAAGYWSMTTKNKHPMQAIAAGENTFFAALMESMMQLEAGAAQVLLVCYEEQAPEPLVNNQPFSDCAIGFVLSKDTTNGVELRLAQATETNDGSQDWSAVYKAYALALQVKKQEKGSVLVSDKRSAWMAEIR